jgi:PAS domain S-box-containing protein
MASKQHPRKPKTASAASSVQRIPDDTLPDCEALFSLFMEHLPAVGFLKDLNGRYVYVNPNFARLTGCTPGLCPGSSDEEYWPDSAARLRAEDRHVIQTGQTLTSEDARTTGGETRHYQTVKFPIPDNNGTPTLIAGISVDITARKVAELERQNLLARLANAHQEERWRISRELHDDLTQRLAALAMDLGRLAAQRLPTATQLKKDLRTLQRRAVQAAEAARHIAHQLHPIEVDDLGLVAALRSYCEDFSKREGIAVKLTSRDIPKELKREIGSCVYKVAKESLSNVARHAATERVSVILDGTADVIRLRVKDFGIGFRTGSPAIERGLGLLSMQERVALLGGNLSIWSQPGEGTEVIVAVPLEAPC